MMPQALFRDTFGGLMNVLGLKIAGHDPGAALISDGRIVAIAEERLNRIKHSPNTFPRLAIAYCLDALGLKPEDIDLVTLDSTTLNDVSVRLPSTEMFKKETAGLFKKARVVRVNHHDAHAATAFFCSPFSEAAVLVYDGAGDRIMSNLGVEGFESETMYRGSGTELVQIYKSTHIKTERRFPYTTGIGKLYSILSTDYIGLGQNNEGKMMGLAAYGDDRILRQYPYERWVADRGGMLVCNSKIRFGKSIAASVSRQKDLQTLVRVAYWHVRSRIRRALDTARRRVLAAHSGGAGDPMIFEPIEFSIPARDPKKDALPDQHYASVAYAGQKIFERFAVELGTRLKNITRADNLCVAGGCALNIDANHNFLTKVGFKNLFVQPASSDCGIPLGCALWGYHTILKQPRYWVMKSASLGRVYSDEEIDKAIAERAHEIESHISDNIAKEAASLIAEDKIIGWFQGGSEYGPRALGNRSILCDARNLKMRDILNSRVKHREMWRPFATSILAEKLQEWFDLQPNETTGFMLLAAPVRVEKKDKVPAIVHVDGTCRMQTLTAADNGIYYELVKEFEGLTSVPLVLNTSFNLGGDPIVESPADALDTFLRTDMDYLVLHDRVIRKK